MAGRCPFHALLPARASATPTRTDPTPPEPLSAALKRLTQAQHDEAEHHAFHRLIMGPEPSLAAYRRQLGQMRAVHAALEPRLRAASGRWNAMGLPIGEDNLHLGRLEDDLRFLGAGPGDLEPLPATVRFVRFIEACGSGDGLGLVGVFYVLEGSTNGGTIIAKRVREVHGWADDRGTRFINPHGPLVRPRWGAIRQGLDALPLSGPERDRVIDAAGATFLAIGEMMTDLLRECSPVRV